jgi:translation initiation factor 2B subunit (eIF-2B alpha/beta/delta family)
MKKEIRETEKEINALGGLKALHNSEEYRTKKLKKLKKYFNDLNNGLKYLKKQEIELRKSKDPNKQKKLKKIRSRITATSEEIKKTKREIQKFGGSPSS